MKQRLSLLILSILLIISVTGCSTKTTGTENLKAKDKTKQKMMVVVVDKKTKKPVKDAKVYIVGMDNPYTTDEMGKTEEIEVDINKGYFENYSEDVRNKMRAGFVNIVVVSKGYGKHMEMDYCIQPGSSTSIAKVEIAAGTKTTQNINKPGDTYIENLVRSYESFEGQGARTESASKYKITVKDENNKPVEGAKIVVPEALTSMNTDKKGICEIEVPQEISNQVNYPVKREYGEITVLVYKEGYTVGAQLKVHVHQDGKVNSLELKLKASKAFKVDAKVHEPDAKWMGELMESYK